MKTIPIRFMFHHHGYESQKQRLPAVAVCIQRFAPPSKGVVQSIYCARGSLENLFSHQRRGGIIPSAFGGIVQLTNFNALCF
jgi:hypothetical protein